jgi:hypothetical protein
MSTLEADLLKSISNASYTNQILNSIIVVSSSTGDIYISGSFFGKLDIGGGVPPITTISNSYSGFIAKYNSSLMPTFLKYMGGKSTNDNCLGGSLVISSSGDVFVTGSFCGTLDIGSGVTPIKTTSNNGSSFIAKYTNNLVPSVLKYMGGTATTDDSVGISLAISSNDDIYISGSFFGTLDIGGGVRPITSTTSNYSNYFLGSGFIAKYTSNLSPTLLKYIGDAAKKYYNNCNSVSISSSGDVYITGNFQGVLEIGGGVTSISTNSTNYSGFIAKYSSNLVPKLLKYMGGTATSDNCLGNSLAISSNDDVYVSGDFQGTLDIGGGVSTISIISGQGSFIAKYTSNLAPTILKYFGGTTTTDFNNCNSVAISSSGDVYVSGNFQGTIDIGGGITPITTSSDQGGFMAKYTNNLVPTLLNYLGGTAKTDFYIGGSLAISSSDDVYVTSIFFGTLDIGGGVRPISGEPCHCIEPICLVSGTPILTDQGIVAIDEINTAINTINNKRIVAITKAITPEKNLICFEPHSVAINCPTKKTIMTSGHEVLYKGKLVQAKHFVGKLNGVYTVLYDGKVLYNVLLEKHSLMNVNNMILETLNPNNKVAKRILTSVNN